MFRAFSWEYFQVKDNIILAHFDFDVCSVRIKYILFVISGLTKYAILHLHKTVGGKILGSYLYPAGGSLSMLQSMRSLTVAPLATSGSHFHLDFPISASRWKHYFSELLSRIAYLTYYAIWAIVITIHWSIKSSQETCQFYFVIHFSHFCPLCSCWLPVGSYSFATFRES